MIGGWQCGSEEDATNLSILGVEICRSHTMQDMSTL